MTGENGLTRTRVLFLLNCLWSLTGEWGFKMKTFKNNSFCKMVVLTSPGERKQKLDLYADLSTFLVEPTPTHSQYKDLNLLTFPVAWVKVNASAVMLQRIVLQTRWGYYCKLKSKDRIVLRLKRDDSSADMQESLVVLQIYIRRNWGPMLEPPYSCLKSYRRLAFAIK